MSNNTAHDIDMRVTFSTFEQLELSRGYIDAKPIIGIDGNLLITDMQLHQLSHSGEDCIYSYSAIFKLNDR